MSEIDHDTVADLVVDRAYAMLARIDQVRTDRRLAAELDTDPEMQRAVVVLRNEADQHEPPPGDWEL